MSSITQSKRIVVKVGTSTLTYGSGKLNLDQIEKLVRELSDLANQGKEIILAVTGNAGWKDKMWPKVLEVTGTAA